MKAIILHGIFHVNHPAIGVPRWYRDPRPIKPTWEPPTHGQARKFPKGAHEEFGGRLPVHQQGKHLVKQGLNMFKPWKNQGKWWKLMHLRWNMIDLWWKVMEHVWTSKFRQSTWWGFWHTLEIRHDLTWLNMRVLTINLMRIVIDLDFHWRFKADCDNHQSLSPNLKYPKCLGHLTPQDEYI